MFGKLTIRNIPKAILDALDQLATLHDRSMEAEARQALRAWVEPLTMEQERTARRAEVAERLNRLLDEINDGRSSQLRPSHIAQAIGEERAGPVEDWFLGREEPSFSQLTAVAQRYGVNADWLIHGDKSMFPVERFDVFDKSATEAVRWLTTWHPGGPVSSVHLVRKENKTGSLLVVKSKNEQFRTFTTPIHVSEEIGAGGEARLANLSVTFKLLYKLYLRRGFNVSSYVLNPSDFDCLTDGSVYPRAILRKALPQPWWEDIWDRSQWSKQPEDKYWSGWGQLCKRIERAVECNTHLREQQQQIRNGTHPAINAEAGG